MHRLIQPSTADNVVLETRVVQYRPIPEHRKSLCIPQIDEADDHFGSWEGRQSCVLTSQLDAFILAGVLNPKEARQIQSAARTNSRYVEQWELGAGEGNFLGWSQNAAATRKLIQTVLGLSAPMSESHGLADIQSWLLEGCPVSLSGADHSVTVFQPAEKSGTLDIVVVNPLDCSSETVHAENIIDLYDDSKPSYIVGRYALHAASSRHHTLI